MEKAIVAAVMAASRRLGWWCCKIHGNAYQLAGLPDVLAIKDGRAVWMECKQPGKEPTRIQNHRMRELIKAGCPCTTVRSAGDAVEFLESVA
jgi:Holliday junction resolvase